MLDTRARREATKKAIKKLNSMLTDCHTKADIARDLEVNKGLITFVLQGNFSPTVLRALDIPVPKQVPVEVCPSCGKLHKLAKSCAAGRKAAKPRYRKIAEMRSQEELDALDEVAEYSGYESWNSMCRFLAEESMDGRIPTIS